MVQITSDIELSGAGCTTAITPNQLVQSSSENDSMTGHFAYTQNDRRNP
ncbi:NTP-binding protein [Klebsiella pneumoniae]|nr:NTP-binding protein [Klebsiella pneumoniae]